MYPPKSNQDLEEVVTGLWASMQRAGEHFSQEARIEVMGESRYVALQLASEMPKNTKAALTYLRQYMREAGWVVKSISKKRNYIEFVVEEKAASSLA